MVLIENSMCVIKVQVSCTGDCQSELIVYRDLLYNIELPLGVVSVIVNNSFVAYRVFSESSV